VVASTPLRHSPARGGEDSAGAPSDGRRVVLAYLALAAFLSAVSAVASVWLPDPGNQVIPPFRGWRWLQGWAQWDSGWYDAIATGGYGYIPDRQSTIAFFPSYPLAMRAVALVVRNAYVAGIVVTIASGAAAARLFFGWLRARMTRTQAWAALGALLLYPYAFFLYGAVYPTAFFVATLLGAFVLLEHDHPWLAGVVGALATAARPTGVVLAVGLAVRAFERRRQLPPDERRPVWHEAGVLVSGLGLAVFCLYQWRRFDDPFAFMTVQSAWDQQGGLDTWLKVRFFEDLQELPDRNVLASLTYLAHPVVTLGALALVPRVFRRFGYGYGVYALLMILVPALSTKNFFGMARYVMAAFPCFAVAGELLAERPKLAKVVYPLAAAGLVLLTAAYSAGRYLS
jgi:Gpi18-like mannosyltransferase